MMNSAKKSINDAKAVASAGPPFFTRPKKNCKNTIFSNTFIIKEIEATITGVLVSFVE